MFYMDINNGSRLFVIVVVTDTGCQSGSKKGLMFATKQTVILKNEA
jgi:hypothetical protein